MLLRRFTEQIPAIATALAVVLAVAGLSLAQPATFDSLREAVFDRFQRVAPSEITAQLPLRVVDIDEESLAQVGQWPWPRDVIATLVARLGEAGAAAIAIDILFAEPDRLDPQALAERFGLPPESFSTEGTDQRFAEAIGGAPVVLGFALARVPAPAPDLRAGLAAIGPDITPALVNAPGAVSNLPAFDAAASGLGAIAVSPADTDAVVRRVPLILSVAGTIRPGLSLEALRVAFGENALVLRGALNGAVPVAESLALGGLVVPLGRDGTVRPRFARLDRSMTLPAGDVLTGDPDGLRGSLEGTIVFIGSSAAGLFDLRSIPLGQIVPGVEVHVQAAAGMLTDTLLVRPDWAPGAELVLLALLALVALALSLSLAPVPALATGALLGLAAMTGSYLLFDQAGLLIDATVPVLAASLGFVAAIAVRLATTDRRQRYIRRAFGQYLSAPVLARLEADPDSLSLGGEERIVTVLFADLVGFTKRSEGEPPEEVVGLLNRIMTPLADAILEQDGTIDKFIGDGLMAFWNAPLDQPDHAARALNAARVMQKRVAPILKEAGNLSLSIGLHSGPAFVGNMGTANRFAYTAIGDTVNIAARIETLTRSVGEPLLISSETAALLQAMPLRPVGAYPVKGRTEPVSVLAP